MDITADLPLMYDDTALVGGVSVAGIYAIAPADVFGVAGFRPTFRCLVGAIDRGAAVVIGGSGYTAKLGERINAEEVLWLLEAV